MICVSVIVPVYNAETYLVECVESILNQTLKEIEIIFINDGSTDNSPAILSEYAKKDNRITIINQSNIGAGLSRNKGITIAKGKYLSFLDADDFFKLDMLEKAYAKAEQTTSDITVFRCNSFDQTSKNIVPMYYTILEFLLPKKEVFAFGDIEKDMFKAFVGWAWDKLFLTEFVKSNNLQFQDLRTSNDMYFVYVALLLAEKVTVLNENLVFHRENTTTSLSQTREISYDNFYLALKKLKLFLIENNIYDRYRIDFINYALNLSLWHLSTLKDKTVQEQLYNNLKLEWFDELEVNTLDTNQFYRLKEFKEYTKIKSLCFAKWICKKKQDNIIISKIKSLNFPPKLRKILYNLRDKLN